jgi:geranylgeranyl pyrophosphate synthase
MLDKNYPADFDDLLLFGLTLGLSFQIKDDLLGYTSSSEVLGKTKNKDELRNQPNYVNLLGVDETIKLLEENQVLMKKILKNIGFDNSMLSEVSNYIFDRKF